MFGLGYAFDMKHASQHDLIIFYMSYLVFVALTWIEQSIVRLTDVMEDKELEELEDIDKAGN